MSRAVPQADSLNAQNLVARGYGGIAQRVYIVKLTDESNPTTENEWETRMKSWRAEGKLPVNIFRSLLACWLDKGYVSSKNRLKPKANMPTPWNCDASYQIDIGISFAGLKALNLSDQLIEIFQRKAPAYAEGAWQRASKHIGDAGASDASHWQSSYRGNQLHVLLFVHAHQVNQAQYFLAFERDIFSKIDCPLYINLPTVNRLLKKDWIEESTVFSQAGEIHFGMLDGISLTRFETDESKRKVTPKKNTHRLGELLLGYPRNDNSNVWLVPGALYQPSTHRAPHPIPERAVYGDFFKEGSFGAFRKMQQDVEGFESYLVAQAKQLQGNCTLGYTKSWLKAKMLGRWENGQLISSDFQLTPECEVKATAFGLLMLARPTNGLGSSAVDLDAFDFKADNQGLGCPFGAHIRRMNPRSDPVVPFLPRPLLRRGVPYGAKDGFDEKGLLGLFFCASIEEQFEHLLGNWANNNPMGTPIDAPGRDPLIGNHEPYGEDYEIPMHEAKPLVLSDTQPPVSLRAPFVVTRGTSYAFFPSIKALQMIADGGMQFPAAHN